jgi:diguanylate cyclase (GGDEF)-like protein
MSIERSTELLRLALPWMSRQAAGLHPVSYAIWFDYVAQTNPPLRAAIDEHLARDGSLDESTTHALFDRHVADVDPETAQRVVHGMQRVLGGIGEAIGAAGAHATRFGASLAQLAGALERGDTARGIGGESATPGIARNGPVPRQLADVVAEVIADTGTMRSQIGGLQQRLADSRREIDRLRDEVRRARDDALLDALTGLSNRRAFDQALTACLTAFAATPGAPAGLASTPTPAPVTPAATARVASAAIEAAMAPPAARPTGAPAAPAPAPPAQASLPTDSPISRSPPEPGPEAAAPRGPWLLMSDIDHFQRINDAYGQGFGDQVLKAVAQALRSVAPAGATLARVGGEAFALLVPELDAAAALMLAERVRQHIGSARIRRPGHDDAERVTLSLGVAPYRAGESPQAFVERSSLALRKAKNDGRNRVASAD